MKLTLGIMFGAQSVEHEISIISAIQAMEALDKEAYDIVPLYFSKDKHLYSGDVLRNLSAYKDLKKLEKMATLVSMVRINNEVVVKPVKRSVFFKHKSIDLVIPIVHGRHAEDGSIVGFCETLGVPYVGSDVIAAAVGQDKVLFKHVLENSKLPVVPWFYFYKKNYLQNQAGILAHAKELGYPLIVKPATLGSSIGIGVAENEREFVDVVEAAIMYDEKILVEKKIEALREINCSTLEADGQYRASVCEEVMKTDAILSYSDKYQSKSKSKGMASTARVIPAEIPEALSVRIQELSVLTSEVLNVGGVVRIDFIYDTKQDEVYINEINSIPGSLAFYLWEADGIGFSELMDRLVQAAIARLRERERMISSYDTNLLASFKKRGIKS